MDMEVIKGDLFVGRDRFALDYEGNCGKCPWLESGYCPCVVSYHPAGRMYKDEDGKMIPVLVIGPGKDSPEKCWESQ